MPKQHRQPHPWAKKPKIFERERADNSLLEGRVLEEERTEILELIRPIFDEREPTRPPKAIWCNRHHKYESNRERFNCYVSYDAEMALAAERFLR